MANEALQPLSLLNALLVTVIGMLIVFFGLTVLIFLIKLLVAVTGNKKKKTIAAPQVQPVRATPAPVEPVVEEDVTDDNELIAVITAALACMMEDNHGFVVRHVKRIQRAPVFSMDGREDQMYSHF